MEKIKEFYRKHREVILYFTLGVVTTVCSLGACWLTLKLGVMIWHDEKGEPTEFLDILGSTIQWVVGVLVSFITNKKWVFINAEKGLKASALQLAKFSGSRVGTYFLEVIVNLAVIALLEWCGYRAPTLALLGVSLVLTSRVWAKVVSSVLVVIANYFISKLFVFKRKKKETQ